MGFDLTLADVPIGTQVVVVSVADAERPSAPGRRLLDLGFVPGTMVGVERRVPLGDPTVYLLRGARIALRKTAATLVNVAAPGNNETPTGVDAATVAP